MEGRDALTNAHLPRRCGHILDFSLEGEALTERMSKEQPMNPGQQRRKGGKTRPPEWADGLKRLYDSVLDEPLPDNFADLLNKLDDPSNG